MGWLYKVKSGFLSWAADIRIYPGGFILFGDSHYHFKGDDMRKVLNVLSPGQVLLRRYSHYLGSVLIPGYYSHAAIYMGNDIVIHMLGEGICKEDILTFMRCDDLAVLRFKDDAATLKAMEKAEFYLRNGVEYDYDFDNNTPDRFYCTEFVDNIFGYPIKNKLGDRNIYPDHFLDKDLFNLIWSKNKSES
jgi:hypothetical protein